MNISINHSPESSDSAWLRGLNRIIGTGLRLGLLPQDLDADGLISEARRNHELSDFGDPPLREPLERLLWSLRNEANLNAFGRVSTRWDMLRLLGSRLELQAALTRRPQLRDQPVEAPLVITGLPRSGSTFLHRLLAEDPTNLVVRHHSTIHPFESDSARRVQRQLWALRYLGPQLSAIHPMTPQTPQECTEVFSSSFRSLRFDSTHRIPAYRIWLDESGSRDAYRLHRRFLQYWQAGTREPRRWVLKSPDHIFTLADLLEEYPDARIVLTHRDPAAVLPSVANLTVTLRRLFSSTVDPYDIGRQVFDRWIEGGQRMIAADRQLTASGRLFHLHYADLVRDPLAAVTSMYRHFDLPLGPSARGAMQDFVREHRQGDYASNHYRFEDYDLTPQKLRDKFADYLGYFPGTMRPGT